MKAQRILGPVTILILAVMLSGTVSATMPFGSSFRNGLLSAATTDDILFIHHSCGENWLSNSLDAALLAKSYIDERNDIYYGTDISPDAGRPDSLQQGNEPPGDHTNMNHWLFWFNDYLESVKGHDAATGFNRIIMFTSCYPISNISGDGVEPGDPFSSSQTSANYKAIYRHFDGPGNMYSHDGYTYKPLEDVFAENSDTLFIPVTAPPMHYAPWDYTSDANAHRAREFNEWLKNDWLARYNAAHPGLNNVAVFDWFDVLTYSDDHSSHPNRLKAEYGGASGDSHANDTANVHSTHVFTVDPGNFIDSAWNVFLSQEVGSQRIASARTPEYGQTVTYTTIIKNVAAPPTATVYLTDVVPASLSYVSGTLAATAGIVTDAAAPTLTWAGQMPPSAVTVTYAVTVTTVEPQIITSAAAIVAPGYQTSTVTTTIVANGCTTYLPFVLRTLGSLDAQAPSEPQNLNAMAVVPNQVDLIWAASTDDVGVEGYRVYCDGSEIAMTTQTAYSDTGLEPLTQHIYTVTAYDAAGNESGQSEAVVVTTASGETLSYVDLVKRLADFEYMATLPQPGEECAQWSSYDRASRYDPDSDLYIDWSANGDALGHIRREDGKYVLAEMQGPGVISRIWSALADQGHVQVYLNGALALDLPFAGYFDGSNVPFTRPALVHETARGLNNYVPIPYQDSCKIVAEEDWGRYYHFNYTTYPQGTILPTFDVDLSPAESEALDNANTILADGGSYPNYEGQVTEQTVVEIAPGETVNVLQLDQSRAITAIEVSTDFAGSIGRDKFYSYWYMPFADSAVLELTNDGIETRTLTFTIKHVPLSHPIAELGRFHAKWHRDAFLPTEPGREIDWTLLKTEGRGRYIGTMLHVWNPEGGWWGEGDEKFFIDGEKFPSTFGTGSEDYFGYAWGSPKLFSNCYHNQTICEGSYSFEGHTSANRWHIADNVPFQQSFEGAIEKYFSNDRPTLYASVAYWYLAPGGIDHYQPLPVGQRTGYWPGTQKQKALRELALSIFWDGETSPSVWSPLGDFFGSAPGANEYESFPMGMRVNILEAEDIATLGMTGGNAQRQDMSYWGSGWSEAAQLQWADGATGDTLDLSLPATEAGVHRVRIQLTKASDHAIVQLYLDGNALGGPIDLYNDGTIPTGRLDMGLHTLSEGTHTLSVEIVGANPQAVQSYTVGIDYVQLKPEGGAGDTNAPSIPQNLSASAASANQIDLTWEASTDDVGVAGYRLFRDDNQLVTTVLTSCSDVGLSASTQYTYTVAAYDARGNESAHSEPVSVTTKAPRLVLHGTPANEAIHLRWDVNTTLPTTSSWHIDYYSQTVTSVLSHTGIVSTTRAYTLTGLSNGNFYTITLKAMLGSSAFLTDTARVMPTDTFVYLPLVLRE